MTSFYDPMVFTSFGQTDADCKTHCERARSLGSSRHASARIKSISSGRTFHEYRVLEVRGHSPRVCSWPSRDELHSREWILILSDTQQHHDELFKTGEIPPQVLAQAALYLTVRDEVTSPDPWVSLARRRFGDTWEKTYTFNDQEVIIRDTPTGFKIKTSGFTDTARTSLNALELTSHFSDTSLTSTIIPSGSKLHVYALNKHYVLNLPVISDQEYSATTSSDSLTSPMPATVIDVRVKSGDKVTNGQVVCVLESMKMEISIRAGRDGIIGSVNVKKGEVVEEGSVLVGLQPEKGDA